VRDTAIIRESADGLYRQVWAFYFYDTRLTLYLDLYADQARNTKRRTWKDVFHYRRLGRDNSIAVADCPLPDDVIQEVLQQFRDRITVKKWDGP
jgi:hypothetical protein